jgi:hypothetical protein
MHVNGPLVNLISNSTKRQAPRTCAADLDALNVRLRTQVAIKPLPPLPAAQAL